MPRDEIASEEQVYEVEPTDLPEILEDTDLPVDEPVGDEEDGA